MLTCDWLEHSAHTEGLDCTHNYGSLTTSLTCHRAAFRPPYPTCLLSSIFPSLEYWKFYKYLMNSFITKMETPITSCIFLWKDFILTPKRHLYLSQENYKSQVTIIDRLDWIMINTVWFSTWKFLAVLVSMSSRSHCLEVGRPFTSLFQWGKQYIISRLLIWFYPSFNKESNICFMKKPIDIIERFHPYIDLWTFWKLFGLSAWKLLSLTLCHQRFRNTVVNINSVWRINYSSNNQV